MKFHHHTPAGGNGKSDCDGSSGGNSGDGGYGYGGDDGGGEDGSGLLCMCQPILSTS